MRKLTREQTEEVYDRLTNLTGGDDWLTTELGILVGRAIGDITTKPGEEEEQEIPSVAQSLVTIAFELENLTRLMRLQREEGGW